MITVRADAEMITAVAPRARADALAHAFERVQDVRLVMINGHDRRIIGH